MTCTYPDCDKPLLSRGLCSGHYARQLRGAPMDAPWRRKGVPGGMTHAQKSMARRAGLYPEDYAHLGDECEVCGATKDLRVDHDHATGLVRGRLCHQCNVALGLLQDSTVRLIGLIRYLNRS